MAGRIGAGSTLAAQRSSAAAPLGVAEYRSSRRHQERKCSSSV